ncbi:UDP-N-acetylmuramoyl-L-alanyl-D-glutamate--2,6-diaminopimelate ligase [Mycoplasmatota bacterium WC44]
MKLRKLLRVVNINQEMINHKVKGIYNNSKECTKDSVFFAIKGSVSDGYDYIDDAINNGARTIFTDRDIDRDVNIIKVKDIKRIFAIVVNAYHKYPTKKIPVIGVTGTNGKTSTSMLIHNFLKKKGSLLIGTNGVYFNDEKTETLNTTPDILTVIRYINKARKKRLKYVVMEVSSIGICEYRVHGFEFEQVIYTNLTADHLDYHKTINNYIHAKKKLLLQTKRHNVLNKDDEVLYSFRNFKSVFYDLSDVSVVNEVPLEFVYKGETFKTNLYGEFNLYNIMAMITSLQLLGCKLKRLKKSISNFSIEGRMDVLNIGDKKIIIDFAHTTSAVENVLKTFKGVAVIGCGGDRDRTKRKDISKVCVDNAEFTIFTLDNPRTENIKTIFDDMTNGLSGEFIIIEDRFKAIEYAIKNYDTVLILGKGHEEYQIIGNKKYPFSDYEAVNKILKE